jgi:hypothetical protein
MKLDCYKPARCCPGRDCDYLDDNPEQPCWGAVEVVDSYYNEEYGEIFIHCCRGHESMSYNNKYIPKNEV